MPQPVTQVAKIVQTDAPKRVVTAIVQRPEVANLNGYIYSAEELRDAAWDFLANYGTVGFMHRDFDGNGQVVESYIAPQELVIGTEFVPKGTWLIAIRVSEPIFQQILEGKITGVSLGGFAHLTEE